MSDESNNGGKGGKGRRGFFGSLLNSVASLKEGLLAARVSSDEEDDSDLSDGPTFVPPPAVAPPASPAVAPRGPRRPPGALPEPDFLSACTRCGACIERCPEETLFAGPDGFPLAQVDKRPCAMCPTTPCITACQPAALVPTAPSAFRFATAVVMARLCLNAPQKGPQRQASDPDAEPCERCLDWCPIPGALKVSPEPSASKVPTVDAALCTGCGLCVAHCPAYPRAIALR